MISSTNGYMQSLEAADGHPFDCWMQADGDQARGGLVILQEIFGVTEQLKRVAKQYAAQNFDVAIPALFDRRRRHAVVPFDDPAQGRELMQSLDPEETLADIAATIQHVAERHDKVAVIGFCWGGGLALRCAQNFDLVGAVAFYGTRLSPLLANSLPVPMLFHFGIEDDHTPPELIEQVRTAYPQAEIHLYECGHAFANDARDSYVADAAGTAHSRTASFLQRVMA